MSTVASSDSDAGYAHSQSLTSLPSSPLSMNYTSSPSYQLSSSLANMSLSGNGLQSSGGAGSQNSSKSHSPAGSTTNTLVSVGKREWSEASSIVCENGEIEKAKVYNYSLLN